MRRVVRIFGVLAIQLLVAAPTVAVQDLTTVQVNLNQIGYVPTEPKVALVETNRKLINESAFARVVTLPGLTAALPDIPIAVDRKGYGKFRHHFVVDFSALSAAGSYAVQIHNSGGLVAQSPPTTVDPAAFNGSIALTTRFFTEQRCGNNAPLVHAACHTGDGTAVGGPQNGLSVDATGGWHDAGDYIKFAATASYATLMQLFARRELAPVGLAPALRTQVRNEAQKGVEWLLRLHPTASAFYFQVADESDHNAPLPRLPENDTVYGGPRPVYYGLGANLAGRTAAVLALCAQEWQGDNPALASACLTAAQEIYALGKSIANGTASDPKFLPLVTCVHGGTDYAANELNCDFYEEDSYFDDMALGAITLYAATATSSYRTDACTYAGNARSAYGPLGWHSVHDLALYLLHPHGAACTFGQAQVLADLQVDVDRIQKQEARDKYRFSERRFQWGSLVEIAGDGVTCMLLNKLTGDASCLVTAGNERDYILGRNPFGVSFITGSGAISPQNPHHEVAALLPAQWFLAGSEIGAVVGGPAAKRVYPFRDDDSLKAAVQGDTASPYTKFQTGKFHYHDIHEDYVSNEPALDYNANVLALLLAYGAP